MPALPEGKIYWFDSPPLTLGNILHCKTCGPIQLTEKETLHQRNASNGWFCPECTAPAILDLISDIIRDEIFGDTSWRWRSMRRYIRRMIKNYGWEN